MCNYNFDEKFFLQAIIIFLTRFLDFNSYDSI